MTDNAFAKAAQSMSGGNPPASTKSNTDPMTGNRAGYDPMFGGQSRPSLFIRSHAPGTELTGIVTDVPEDKQDRFYVRDGSLGALKFWGDDNKPTDQPTDAQGNPRRPVESWVYPMQTEYRDRGKDGQPDDGARAFYAGNQYAKEAMKKAIRAAGLSSREQIKGMRLTILRHGEEGKWDYVARLTRD